MSPREAQLEAFFRKRVRLAGGYTIKLAPTERGVPDRLVMFPRGQVYLVELKADGGRLSPIQAVLHERINERYQVHVYVLTGEAQIQEWIRAAVEASTPRARLKAPQRLEMST